ncbi:MULTISPECIES: hypothetical protein [unclassified Salinivibrio]|uniref:hypothetical protein n=1 Tax=unclassified Salinivibrio TaxID=2636825 RepID=UPI00128E43C9|nr:hypothetical protein [Salinivibrio sp. VYel7]MPX94018.1 hypothetical protein [Salinivibrio sp. VYel9]MPY00122.1 hypothetical protein [Salinivibrio sp. VYel4]MPY03190.1 hypothetical protein [Salinivibrio sp. VYel5]
MKVALNKQQKRELGRQHEIICDGRVRDRIKAVLLASEGWSKAMISQARCIYGTTVRRHFEDYAIAEGVHSSVSPSQFFTATLPDIAGSLTSRINDNFKMFNHAS